jgi:hypothetical protein
MKYAWELGVYFTFYVFPFIKEAFTDLRLIPSYLREVAILGKINRNLQQFITDYYRWKKIRQIPANEPQFFDFMEFGALRSAERLFYEVGISPIQTLAVIAQQSLKLIEFARVTVAYICASVSGNESLLKNRQFIEGLDLDNLTFDAENICRTVASANDIGQSYPCVLDAERLVRLRGTCKEQIPSSSGSDWVAVRVSNSGAKNCANSY